MNKYCTKCGNPLNEGDHFCAKCGTECKEVNTNVFPSIQSESKKPHNLWEKFSSLPIWAKISYFFAFASFLFLILYSGNLFIFTSYNQLGRWYNSLDHRFDSSNFMIWHKTNPAPKIYKAGFLNSCEMIFTCWNKRHTWNFSTQDEMHIFIESPICSGPERLKNPKHPTQKPIAILKRMIEMASNEDDIIFDPFMGVGSTGVAAMQMNRRFIGVELDPQYCQAGKLRIEAELDDLMRRINKSAGYSMFEDSSPTMVCEEFDNYYTMLDELHQFFSH